MNMREEFEKWLSNCLGSFVDMSRDDYGVYQLQDVRLAWMAWQAAQPKWIKCSDSNPGCEDIILRSETASVWLGGYDEEHKCFFEYSGECVFDFTHWMPLPNPPEE